MRQMRQWWFVGDADELLDEVVGSVQRKNEIVLTRTRKMRKEAVSNSVWLKKVIKRIWYILIK
jgi:hypothetical protein